MTHHDHEAEETAPTMATDSVWDDLPDRPAPSAPRAHDTDSLAPEEGAPRRPDDEARAGEVRSDGSPEEVRDVFEEGGAAASEAEAGEAEADTTQPDWPGEDLVRRVGELEASISELAALERRHLGIIEQLHADNTRLRQGELGLALKPILLSIATLYDDVDRIAESGSEPSPNVRMIRELIADLLERHGVLTLDPAVGTPFDPARHVAVGIVATDDRQHDSAIAEVRRIGFLRDADALVRPAQVVVFRHRAAGPADAEPAPITPVTDKD